MLERSRRRLIGSESAYDIEDEYVPQREDDDIPLPDIGKLVKGLWRSISRGAKDQNSREATHASSLRSQHNGSIAEEHEGDGKEKEREWVEGVTWRPTVDFTAASFSIHESMKDTQDKTASTRTFSEKSEGVTDEGGKMEDSDERDSHMKADTGVA
jgi:hypothetical protein